MTMTAVPAVRQPSTSESDAALATRFAGEAEPCSMSYRVAHGG
jgi:hypothetical protein